MKKLLFIGAVFLIAFIGCSESEVENKDAVFTVMLTDSPAAYEEVLIDIQDVKINPSGINDETSWMSMENVNTGIYNLLDFTNGLDTLLAEMVLPPGLITQIRLVLGNNNSVKKEGVYYDLKTPSAQQSGLKLNIHAELMAGIHYKIWIDFDASRSIVEKGNGTFSLKPVLRTYTEATSGALKGVIDPVEAKPYVFAVSAELDTSGTFADTISGNFMIAGLEAGNYKIEVLPIEGYERLVLENIAISTGEVRDMDTLFVSELLAEDADPME